MTGTSRRDFLKTSTSAALGGGLLLDPGLVPGAWAGGGDLLRVGLVGCGNRGSGAALNALQADANVKLVAMGDAFADRIDSSLGELRQRDVAAKIAVDDEHKFVGFEAYQKVIDACDVVLLCEPPHFRPRSLAYAVERGRHCFVEKPVATDAPGVRSVVASCELARQKKLAVVSGLCYRYDQAKLETMARLHEGAIGDIVALQATYNTNGLWYRDRQPQWSDVEWQVRNWLYFTWLSGDLIAEQHIHSLDKVAWAMADQYPVKATASGGRVQRTDPKFGNVYDHFNTVYEWANGVKCFSSCRQWDGCDGDVNDYAIGTKGVAALQQHRIEGETPWRAAKERGPSMYQREHDALFASIRKGEPIHNGDYMWKSTLMAILGRMAAYTGKTIGWEQALGSQEKLGPETYAWGELSVPPVAVPGVTKFA
jgi:predicted dehydrogenase